MDISAKKLELMQLLLQEQEETVLLKIEKAFEKETDWYDDLSHKQKDAIQSGVEDADNGRVVSHEKVMSKFDKWH